MKSKLLSPYSIIGFVILSIALVAALYLVKQSRDIREKAAPATSLLINPPSQNKIPGQTFTVSVVMDTGINQVIGADLVLTYDQNILLIDTVNKGSGVSTFDQEIKNKIDATAGKIQYSIYTAENTNAVSGSDIVVLTINGRVRDDAQGGDYKIDFDPATTVSGVSEGQNVLLTSTFGTVKVTVQRSSEEPTETPIPTPESDNILLNDNNTPTPTATATLTPSATSTPSPNATATADGISTSTPTDSPTTIAQTQVTATPETLPETGMSLPTIIFIGFALLIISGSFIAFLL